VKRLFFIIVTLVYANNCQAQEVVKRKNKLTDMVTEKYQTIIGAGKQIKQGIYNAFYDRSTVIANGSYANDKKKGMWHFFDQNGKLIENYNYDTNSLLYEASEDSTSNIKYRIDNKVTFTDVVTKPVRPGGRYYGYVPYLRAFKLPDDMFNINREEYAVTLEILVSALGRLADFKIHSGPSTLSG